MFESHFGLTRTPFSREIPAHSLFLTRNHREALSRLHYTAQRRQVMILIGDSGVGKSTVLRRLKHELDPTSYDVLYLNQTGATIGSFYLDLLTLLKMDCPHNRVKARAQAAQALLDRYQIHRRTPVLLLDEAQEMPDELLDAVRGLLNYDCDAFSPFALVLVGTRRLANRIDQQRHAALSGRIHMPFRLNAFTPQETAEYVQHHLQVAGAQRPIFTEPALKRLHQTSNGNARRINRIAVLCLLSAALTKQDLIDDELVSQVVASELGEEAQ
ncbi:MAG: ExeA family protein [Limnochordia bacterium]